MQASTRHLDEDIGRGHPRQVNRLDRKNVALRRQLGMIREEVNYQCRMITAQALELQKQDEEIDVLKGAAILTDITIADQHSELRRLSR